MHPTSKEAQLNPAVNDTGGSGSSTAVIAAKNRGEGWTEDAVKLLRQMVKEMLASCFCKFAFNSFLSFLNHDGYSSSFFSLPVYLYSRLSGPY
jgi:hypothetical protein